ncbi:hypothetical protein C8Q77DRAFT_387609 [Trametes polyzona]|nr:hypothetical protein C8Q77DRAFT_387609 [Trametes polyzona]
MHYRARSLLLGAHLCDVLLRVATAQEACTKIVPSSNLESRRERRLVDAQAPYQAWPGVCGAPLSRSARRKRAKAPHTLLDAVCALLQRAQQRRTLSFLCRRGLLANVSVRTERMISFFRGGDSRTVHSWADAGGCHPEFQLNMATIIVLEGAVSLESGPVAAAWPF